MSNETDLRDEMTEDEAAEAQEAISAAFSDDSDLPGIDSPAKGKAKKDAARGRKKSKKQKNTEPLTLEQVRAVSGGLIKSLNQELVKEYADPGICTLGDAGKLLLGIPFPSLCLEYAFQVSALPLGRVAMIVGTEGSMKSAFTMELARWFFEAGGFAVLKEHESKFSESLARSIIGWQYESPVEHLPCHSVDDWQSKQQFSFDKIKKDMIGTKERPGAGKVFPVLSIIDSIMSKAMQETQDKIATAGFAGRNWPAEALSIANYMRKIPGDLVQWPFVIVGVNHLKPTTDDKGIRQRNQPGGRSVKFQETFEIEIRKGKKLNSKDWQDDERTALKGRELSVKLYKNALGTDELGINVNVFWQHQPCQMPDGSHAWKQKTWFEWHAATINMLLHQESASLLKRIKDIVDLNKVRSAQNSEVWSECLGIPEDEPVSQEEAGRILMEHTDVVRGLRKLLGIDEIKVFHPGVDYDQQRQSAKIEFAEECGFVSPNETESDTQYE